MKKGTLIISTILASAMLVGGTFAAYAVTDAASPFGVYISPNDIKSDDVDYVTLAWGESTSLNNLENIDAGSSYKVGVINLKSTSNYAGVLSLTLEDASKQHVAGNKKFIDYVQLHVYEGAQNDVEAGELPSVSPLAETSLGVTSLVYDEAIGTASGKEYSIFLSFDASAFPYVNQMKNDVLDLTVDWNAQEGDVREDDKTVYFSTNWENCYLYAWNDKTFNEEYPGVPMTIVGKNQYHQNVFKCTLLGSYTKMIISNGGTEDINKTKDISVSDFTFNEQGLLFWRNEDGSVGHKDFEESDAANYAANLGVNPGPILQAWGWTTAKVKENIQAIKDAGYKAVQLSPMQPVGGGSSTNDGWYMLYQPLGFEVAEYNQNPIGNIQSLTELTAAADAVGVDIIVDVVTNHLAGGDGVLYSGVRAFEEKIYDEKLVHNDGNLGNNEGDTYNIVRGHVGGLPDLQTENEFVQSRVIHLLKEYIDCGVKGFRFDAAKHIETPNDPENVKSYFWQNVIKAINEHGMKSYGKAPFSYGEILGVGTYRSWSGYTDYIDVTDNGVAWSERSAFCNANEGSIRDNANYTVDAGKNAVLFGESHDTWTKEGTADIYGPIINMLYGFNVSRVASSAFYFARPSSGENLGNNTKIVINNPMDDYKNSVITAANKLHNSFVGGSEFISAWGGCAINALSRNGRYGVYICNPHMSSSATIKVAANGGYLPTGVYKNLITGETVNVTYDQEFTVSLFEGVAVLELK